jgi:quinol monooxygenase YgiN
MSEVVVVAQINAKPGSESALEKALLAVVEPTHMESGCIRYALHRSMDKPGVFYFLERWRSKKDLDDHLERGHMKTLFAKLAELTAGDASIEVMEAIPHGQLEKGEI